MLETIVIAMWFALNMAPPEASGFTLESTGHKIQFTRQATGWLGIELPQQELGTFTVEGTRLKIQGAGGDMNEDIGSHVGLSGAIDWAELKSVKLGDNELKIERTSGGVDYVVPAKDGRPEERYQVRWHIKG